MVALRVEWDRSAAVSAPNWHHRVYDSSLRPPWCPPMSCDQKNAPTLPAVAVNGTSKASIDQPVYASPLNSIGYRWSPQPAQRLNDWPRWPSAEVRVKL
jgi:hypothetical protein